jgi:ABC-type dipeptide/oligopeptide/nickel transport system permease component
MLSYILRRLLLLPPTLIGITIVVFCVMALSPGGLQGVIDARTGTIDPRTRAAVREFLIKKYGLDKPLPVQYLRWLNNVSPLGRKIPGAGWPRPASFGFKRPDLGESIESRRPVADLIAESLPMTLLLESIAIPLMLFISVASGIAAARNRGGAADVGGGTILLSLYSIPQIWAGVLLIGFLANREHIHIFPAGGMHDLRADEMNFLPSLAGGFQRGWLLDTTWHLILPVACLTYIGIALASKLTRGSMLENIAADFVRTARAKGLPDRVVIYRHAFRNALLPLITYCGLLIPSLISGSVIVETIFSLPGMGKLDIDAVFNKDPELVLSTTLVAALLGLVSYLLADIAYAMADPRVSFEAQST